MVIVKYYTCKKYNSTSCKLYKLNKRNGEITKESSIFNLNQLDDMLYLYRVKDYITIACDKLTSIKTLNNLI